MPTALRLYVDNALCEGNSIALPKAQSHYLRQVMRAQDGAVALLFNGTDGEWQARLAFEGKKDTLAVVEQQTKPQNYVADIWFMFAPLKQARTDFTAQKATELGAAALMPIITQRTIASRVNLDRLQANAIEAAEQCERLDVPKICEPQKLAALLKDWDPTRLLIYGDETGYGAPPEACLSALPASQKWAALIGPEGGFTAPELDQLRNAPFAHGISLGPRVMRADTAAIALLTCLQIWCGDWHLHPRFESE